MMFKKNQEGEKEEKSTREKLAENAHESWVGWMSYLFQKSTLNGNGTVTIPAGLVERWTRQMNTPYDNLPDEEKQSDLDEADKILEIIES